MNVCAQGQENVNVLAKSNGENSVNLNLKKIRKIQIQTKCQHN